MLLSDILIYPIIELIERKYQIIEKYPNIVEVVHGNPSLLRDIRTRCEQMKCKLATELTADIRIEYTEQDVFEYT